MLNKNYINDENVIIKDKVYGLKRIRKHIILTFFKIVYIINTDLQTGPWN